MPYRSTKFQENMFVPASSSSFACETSAVEPKPSAGTVPLTIVGASRVFAKFVAASLRQHRAEQLLAAGRRSRAFVGTMNGSPAVECIASYGILRARR